jgi:hypothetical protein
MPGEGVCEAYYCDMENAFAGLANLIGTLGFVGSILPEADETKPIVRAGRILTKLAAFVRDVDLGMDYAFFTRYHPDRHAVTGRSMTRVRVPAPSAPSAPKERF